MTDESAKRVEPDTEPSGERETDGAEDGQLEAALIERLEGLRTVAAPEEARQRGWKRLERWLAERNGYRGKKDKES